ncbi:hypothetical protein PsorP6_006183 [Peronosclerospora sorghi]|uniref:Uncharacterized protein n=1 Tax=Peronosclerospora sorghi TaxID=230839 RepID=A0ACC0W331_9STRA|nr:hypothetical protein PsorP6_006183 [Peronosclerospora sorghi]
MYNPPNVNTSFSHKRKFVKEQNETTRYLGHQVGILPLAHTNWAVRIRAIKRRVITATNCGTPVIERIQVFNAVIVPAILLTAKMFPPSPAVLKQLVDIQKKFIWGNQSNEDKKCKISPLMIYIPRRAGGLGGSNPHPNGEVSNVLAITSKRPSARIPTTVRKEPTELTYKLLQQALGPSQQVQDKIKGHVTTYLPRLIMDNIAQESQPTTGVHQGEVITIQITIGDDKWHEGMPEAIQAFWGTFRWHGIPWILEASTSPLERHNRFGGCKGHTRAKTIRWLAAIIVCSPLVPIGQIVGDPPALDLVWTPKEYKNVKWVKVTEREMHGIAGSITSKFFQREDGIYWDRLDHAEDTEKEPDSTPALTSVVFKANPKLMDIHGTPPKWEKANRLLFGSGEPFVVCIII